MLIVLMGLMLHNYYLTLLLLLLLPSILLSSVFSVFHVFIFFNILLND